MPIDALLSIDDGKTLNDHTTFQIKPEVGEKISFWKGGREAAEATVSAISHHQVEGGYILVVEAKTANNDIDAWIGSVRVRD